MTESIQHRGIVEQIREDGCSVRILQASACSSCSARQLCRSSESKEKVIEVTGHYPTLRVGDVVTLSGTIRQGLRATILAYILPLLLMVAALAVGTRLEGEGTGALASIAVLAVYYAVLYLLRGRLGRQFTFEVVPSLETSKYQNEQTNK